MWIQMVGVDVGTAKRACREYCQRVSHVRAASNEDGLGGRESYEEEREKRGGERKRRRPRREGNDERGCRPRRTLTAAQAAAPPTVASIGSSAAAGTCRLPCRCLELLVRLGSKPVGGTCCGGGLSGGGVGVALLLHGRGRGSGGRIWVVALQGMLCVLRGVVLRRCSIHSMLLPIRLCGIEG